MLFTTTDTGNSAKNTATGGYSVHPLIIRQSPELASGSNNGLDGGSWDAPL